ncbi:MAG: alpha/beta hydrolase [Proteobacteria bacterium]|nr:alpha/beta hydrolase [Pseudomonadota bacterium]
MYLNTFAASTDAHDMTGTDEFRSLLASAADLGIPHDPAVPYASRNAVLRGLRFHFLEWGRPGAPPIVLLHGGHQSAHSWDLVSLSLARRHHVFALDQRGHGDSEWARDVEYGNHTMSLDAEAFIERFVPERPVLVGHSMGGRNAMLLAKRGTARLRAMVIVDVGPEISDEGRQAIAGFIRTNQEFDDLDHFVANVRKYDPYRPREHIERTARYNMLRRADGKFVSKCDSTPRRIGLQRGNDPLDHIELSDARGFDLPVLLVRGEKSNILTPDAAERFRDALPHGTLVTVPDCGHNVHGQNTLGFLAALNGFLEALG